MGSCGDAYENSMVESFFSTLAREPFAFCTKSGDPVTAVSVRAETC